MTHWQVIEGMYKWGVDPLKVPPVVRSSEEPIIRLFSYHDAHPVTFSMVLTERFGHEWIFWEPETLRFEILEEFKANSISEQNWQKIQAAKTLLNAVGFWREWQDFEKITQALNNNFPRFDIGQKCSVAQLMAGVDMANSIRKETFDDEIARYVAACAIDEGVTYLPEPLGFAATALAEPKYKCLTCGNTDYDDLKDGLCDFCSGRFQGVRPLNWKPVDYSDKNAAQNIVHFLTRNPAPAKKRFEEFLKNPNLELGDTSPEDVQAAKLMVAYRYMMYRRGQLVEQLEELKSWVSR